MVVEIDSLQYFTAPCQFGSDITDELEALFNETSPLVDRRKRIKLQENHHDGGFEADGDQQQSKVLEMLLDIHFFFFLSNNNNNGFLYSAQVRHAVTLMALQQYYPWSLGL